jgi:hypothetical protein
MDPRPLKHTTALVTQDEETQPGRGRVGHPPWFGGRPIGSFAIRACPVLGYVLHSFGVDLAGARTLQVMALVPFSTAVT